MTVKIDNRTVSLSPRIGVMVEELLRQAEQINAIQVGSWQVHFTNTRIHTQLSQTYRGGVTAAAERVKLG